MRVEDLDTGRVRPAYVESQLRDLRWLGLDWDEGPDVGGEFGPYVQSARGELYDDAIDRLRDRGLVYSCGCSRREIAAAASAPHVGEEGPPYPGTCRDLPSPSRVTTETRPHALRFRVPEGTVTFVDALRGEVGFEPASETGDFVIRRKDGIAAYQLAVVVDDAAMRITDVVRGADLLSSTARQLLLYRALDLPPPRWMHVPLMLLEYGERLSKRHASLTLASVRERGVPSERLVGWLAYTCRLEAREGREIEPQELIGRFDMARIPVADTPVRIPDWLRGDD